MNNFFRINLQYNEGTTKDGKKFKVPHTIDFGYNLTVQFNGNSRSMIQHDDELNCDYVVYDATKAAIKPNAAGYMVLHIID